MALSRLRLRLAFAFTLAFAAGLAVLAAIALGFLWRESRARLDARLGRMATDVRSNLAFEMNETPDSNAWFVATEVVNEWPRNGGSFLICNEAGQSLASSDTTKSAAAITPGCRDVSHSNFDARSPDGIPVRAVVREFRIPAPTNANDKRERVFEVVAFASTAGISEDSELLLAAMGVAAPLILLLSLSGGYLMARRALRPVSELEIEIANIAPNDLSKRLVVAESRDELGALAAAFNALLARLNSAQTQNRKFLREAAHQIRTPLTLVLGEAALELSATDTCPERMRGSLTRINLAAERMRRRVDELFLLAEAQTGEPVRLSDQVELDGVVLGAVDLMRPRSTALGKALAIASAQPIVVQGNSELLHEALLELLENALRHGDASLPVTVSVYADGESAVLEVASGGSSFSLPVQRDDAIPQGLGLPIVRWVADVHGGALTLTTERGLNVVRMVIPIRAASGTPSQESR